MRTAREQALSALLPVREGAARDVRNLLTSVREKIETTLARTRALSHLRVMLVARAHGAAGTSDALLIETSSNGDLEQHAGALLDLFGELRVEFSKALEGTGGADDRSRFLALLRAHQLRVGAITRFTPAPTEASHESAIRGAELELTLLLPADLVEWAKPEEDLVSLRRRAALSADRAFAADPGSRRGLVLLLPLSRAPLRSAALRALLRSRQREVHAPPRASARLLETRCVPVRGRGLLFSFDFEGRLDAALEELVARDGAFLNAVFAQAEGFPRRVGWFLGGTREEERFRLWVDAHRLENGVAYVAPRAAEAGT